jgi:hypothetical protein
MVPRDVSRRLPHPLPAAIGVFALALGAPGAHAQESIVPSPSGSGLSWAVAVAAEAAEAKLSRTECRQVFADFRGLRGDSIQTTLDGLGETGLSYLARLDFYDGNGSRACEGPDVVAFTRPGSRAVFLCPAFTEKAHRDPGLAASLLIHEELHALGLGENPPAGRAITAGVIARCGK